MSTKSRPDLLPKTLDQALGRLIEEMNEAGVEIGHIMRFGYHAKDRMTGNVYDNGQALMKELKDVQDAIEDYKKFYVAYYFKYETPQLIEHGNVNIQLDDSDLRDSSRPKFCRHPLTQCTFPQCGCNIEKA